MRTITRLALALTASLGALAAPAYAEVVARESSPDGQIKVAVETDGEGRIRYSITRADRPVIAPSQLGFLFTDAPAFDRGMAFVDQTHRKSDSTWEQPWGERRFVRDNYREMTLRFKDGFEDSKRIMGVTFRVYNDGVGFRYVFPGNAAQPVVNIQDELTQFAVAQPGTAFWIVAGDGNRYEQIYNKTAIDAVSSAHTPMTLRLQDGTHLSFHEAALVDYAGMWLKRMNGETFRATLSPSGRGARVSRKGAFTTPWRAIRIAPDAKGLVENDLELNLNEPNTLGDVSWVKPFKYIGIWWDMHLNQWSWNSGAKHGATTEHTKRYIDFAAQHGFRGVLVEGWNKGWEGNWFGHGDFSFTQSYPDFDIKAVTDYARAKGVRLIGHHETGGNIWNYEDQLEPAMALYQKLGVDAVKTGYVAEAGGIRAKDESGNLRFEWHDGQVMSRHHLKVVEAAARHHVMVNAHEPIKDTGLRRTYPNWVAREGARGMEYDAWGVPLNPANHIAMLVYTRLLSGPMDYTPGVLSLTGRDGKPFKSTLAKQLAEYVVVYSPIQMAADTIENLAKFPRELDFISKVPADWSESHLIAGEVGESAVFARKDRNSRNWYVGGVTDENARDIDVPLTFLDAGKTYKATIYRDAPDADFRRETRGKNVIEEKTLRKADRLMIRMAPGGGFAVRLQSN